MHSISRRRSLWHILPVEIRSYILSKCDYYTRYINNDLTTEDIEVHGNEIWRIVFENDYIEYNLSLLPQHHLPNIDNGLGLVKYKEMYQRLGDLRPDLLNTDLLKTYLEDDNIWNMRHNNPPGPTHDSHLSILSPLLLHIPLRHLWWDHFPSWFSTIDNQILCTFACCFNHVDLAKTLLESITTTNSKTEQTETFLRELGKLCFEKAAGKGYIGIIKLFISLDSTYLQTRSFAFPLACYNGHLDIVTLFINRGYGSAARLLDVFKLACSLGNIKAVRIALEFSSMFSEFNSNWMFEGMINATRLGDFEIVNLLMTRFEGIEKTRVCEAALNIAAIYGNLRLVELLAVVEGVDVEPAIQVAAEEQHGDVVEFLVRVKTGRTTRPIVP
ncbi:hypothetical protein HDU76_005655 [Blyttiomyces sp. JEL0837]|nr:hypothetical protein HDU76_005655 [Blyttiomyces sp. JEL0837]